VGDIDGVTFGAEPAGNDIGHLAFVFNEQQSHGKELTEL
jgi:hypothetical protein